MSLAFCAFWPRVPLALALCVFSCPPLLFSPPFFFLFVLLASPLLVYHEPPLSPTLAVPCFRPQVSSALALCGFSSPPLLSFFVFFLGPPPTECIVPCAACCPCVLCCVLCCGCPPRIVVVCCAFGVLCRALPCCWLLLCAVLPLPSCCPAPLFALWLAVAPLATLPRAVPCPQFLCCAALPRTVLLCAGLLSPALFGAAACCVVPSGSVRRPGVLFLPALCFSLLVRALCSAWCAFCCSVLLRGVVWRCAVWCLCPGGSCCALCWSGAPVSSCSLGLCCFWRLVLWCVLCPLVLWGVVLRCAAGCVICCAAALCAVSSCVLSWCAAAPLVRCCMVLCWHVCAVPLCRAPLLLLC